MYATEYYLGDLCRGASALGANELHITFREALSIAKPRNATILDIGCGRGELVIAAALEDLQNLCFGIDYSPSAVAIANQNIAQYHSSLQARVQFARMDAKRLEYPDGFFDFVFMVDVVEHLREWELEESLNEAHRVLKADGRLIIHTSPNKWLMAPVRLVLGVFGIKTASEPFHINEQSVRSLKQVLRQNLQGRIWITRDRKFWSYQTVGNNRLSPQWSRLASLVDYMLDSRIVSAVIDNTPLQFILGTDVWADVQKPIQSSAA